MTREDGFTIVELLTAITIGMIVLIATLTTLDRFVSNTRVTDKQNEAQDNARLALDRLENDLRNHAAAAPDQQLGIDKATATDLVFQTVDTSKPAGSANVRNVKRVRYCLDTSVPNNEKIWIQSQTWTTAATPAAPSTASCPAPAWPNQRILFDRIVNYYGGRTRPVWTANGADLAHTSSITTDLFVDSDPSTPPAEHELTSSVSFRNANQAPVADFSWLINANGSIVLNASGSYDPEGSRVTYTWYEGSTLIGQGLAFTWDDATAGAHTITLTATDDSGISQSVTHVVQ